jgi:hypothetical protein
MEHKELICSYIQYIIRAAIASSPSTSLFKSDEAMEAALASLGTEGAMLYHGISPLDEEDESSESSELPNMDFSITQVRGKPD